MLGDFPRKSMLAPGLLIFATSFAVETPPTTSQAHGRTLALQGRVSRPAFSPDGKLIATVATDGRVTLWDVTTAEAAGPPLEVGYDTKKSSWTGDRRGQLSFSPDGRSLVWWFEDKVVVWDVATRQVIGRPAGAGMRVFKGVPPRSVIGFSPDGQVLLLETGDGFVFWSIEKRRPAGPPLKDVESGIRLSPDGRMLAEGGIRYSPDGHIIAVTKKDSVALWEADKALPTGTAVAPFDSLKDRLVGLVFSPDGTILAGASSGEVILWDVAKREVAGVLNRSGGGISKFFWGADSQVLFSPNGRVLAWLSNRGGHADAGEIILWDVTQRRPIAPPLGGHPTVRTVVFSPDSKMMASGGNDHSLILWDVWSGRMIGEPLLIGGKKRYGRFGAGVATLAFSANGETLVVGTGQPALLELWDVAHQPPQLLRRFDHPEGFAMGPDRKILAFRTDGQLALWDLANRDSRHQPVIVPGFEGKTFAFSSDSATLATYEDEKTGTTITLWDVATLLSPDRGR